MICSFWRFPSSLRSRGRTSEKSYFWGFLLIVTHHHPGSTHPATLFTASLLVGGTRKQMDGTVASLPLSFSTLHLKGCELLSRAHSSPRCTMICKGPRAGFWENVKRSF